MVLGPRIAGRQVEALPESIDVLPSIVSEANDKATIIFASGVRSGVDVARAVALGADAAFIGKAFLWSLGALGPEGPAHYIVLIEELRSTMGQLGCFNVEELRAVHRRHPGAWGPADLAQPPSAARPPPTAVPA